MMGDFDAIIIGAGQAGSSLAGRLTDAGMTVALVVEHSADLHAATEQVFAGCLDVGDDEEPIPVRSLIVPP